MIKSLKKHAVFHFIAMFSVITLQAMDSEEQNSESKKNKDKLIVENGPVMPSSLCLVLTNSVLKQNNQTLDQQDTDMNLMTIDAISNLLIRLANKKSDNTEKSSVNQWLNGPRLLDDLKYLANAFLAQHWIISELRAMIVHTQDLIDTAIEAPPCCFITDEKTITSHEHTSEDCTNAITITNKEAKLLITSIVKRLWFEEGIWGKSDILNGFYHTADQSIASKNKEVSIVAKYIKNALSRHWFEMRMKAFVRSCLETLAIMKCNEPIPEVVQDLLTDFDGLQCLVSEYLNEKRIYIAVKKLLPNFINTLVLVWKFKNTFFKIYTTSNDVINLASAKYFHEGISAIISTYEVQEANYQQLYKEIFVQLDGLPKNCRQVFLVPGIRVLPIKLEVPIYESEFRNYESEIADKFDYISDLISIPKKGSQNKSAGKKKPRKRRRRVKGNAEKSKADLNDNKIETVVAHVAPAALVKEEHIKFPIYAQRLKEWFKGIRTAPDERSRVYHTYSKVGDWAIKEFGVFHRQPNQLLPEKMDSAYYMEGEIIFRDGRKECAFFGLCFYQGECYHRGFKEVIDSKYMSPTEFEKFKRRFEKSKLLSKDTNLPLITKQVMVDEQETTFEETPYYIRIYDPVHEAIITLFKPEPMS